ncbi:hypothetical protein IPC1291_07330 [Pseudomonas aeruginosa]|nr:hypothetical protein IPC1291_07330 [Pseudomonas aeruginosa]RQB35154.1 hypothetical protein IPC460_14205 [Pseudomonas aeruginosa]
MHRLRVLQQRQAGRCAFCAAKSVQRSDQFIQVRAANITRLFLLCWPRAIFVFSRGGTTRLIGIVALRLWLRWGVRRRPAFHEQQVLDAIGQAAHG